MRLKPVVFLMSAVALVALIGFFIKAAIGVRETEAGGQVRFVEYKRVEVGQLAPDFGAQDVHKNEFVLSKLGKIKVVNFWASWCGPCIQEMPSMAAVAKEKAEQIELVAISCDDREKDYRQALNLVPSFKDSGIRIVFDPSKKLMSAYGVKGLPETFIIGSDGKLIKKIVGSLDWLSLPDDFFEKP